MTTEVQASILAQTARGAGWVIGWRMLTRVLGLISTLCLVRLLVPADFGLVTLAMSFSQAIDSLSSLGVEEAVIREKDPSRDLYDSAFTINVIRGTCTALVLAAVSWPVAQFFGDVRLFAVMLILAASSLAASLENIGIVDFRRELTFEKEFVLMAVPRLVSIMVAIGLAWVLRSHWALICAIVTGIVLRVAMGYAMSPYRPRLSLRAWRQIAGFSFWSWLLSLSGLLLARCDSFVIGKVYDITRVGVFALGSEIAALPTTELISPLSRACFSGFASARGGTAEDTARYFVRIVASTTLVALPAGVGISLVADSIVKLAFGASWTGATEIVQILGVAMTTTILGMISGALLNAHAMLKTMFWIQACVVVGKIVLLTMLTSRFGLAGAAAAVATATVVEQGAYLFVTLRHLAVSGGALMGATWRSIAGAIVMVAGLSAAGLGWTTVDAHMAAILGNLVVAVPFGAVLYCTTVALCWVAIGRPAGAERDMAGMARQAAQRAANVVGRQLRARRAAG